MSVIRNTTYNLAAMVIPALVGLATVPPYIHAMGEARYGVIALIGTLLGYFGVFDLGLGAAATQKVAATPAEDLEGRRAAAWTAILLNLGLGLAGTCVLLPVAWLAIDGWFKVPPELLPELRQAIGWIALALPVMMLNGVLRGVLIGAGEFAQLNLASVVMSLASQILPLAVAVWISPSLTVVLPVLYATRGVLLAWCMALIVARVTRSWRPVYDRGSARALLGYGGWMTLSGLINPVLTSLDRLLIGSRIGVGAVSYYTVPAQLAERFMVLPGALLQAVFPRVASATTDAEALALTIKAQRALAALLTPPLLAGVVFMHPLLALWIGPRFADAAALPGQILLCGYWWNAFGMSSAGRLQAQGRPRLIALAHGLEVVPYVGLLMLLIAWLGLPGAALAFALRIVADDLILAWFAGLFGEMLRLSLVGAALFAPALWLGMRQAPLLSPTSGLGLVFVVAVGLASLAQLARLTDNFAFLLDRWRKSPA